MTIIRNPVELARHNQSTDETLRNHPALAAQARQRHAALLAWWMAQPAVQRASFDALFGQPPTS